MSHKVVANMSISLWINLLYFILSGFFSIAMFVCVVSIAKVISHLKHPPNIAMHVFLIKNVISTP